MKDTIKLINLLTIVGCVIAIIILFITIGFLNNFPGEDVIAKRRALIALLLLVPIMVCNFANGRLEKTHHRKGKIFVAILTLLFGNVVSGILMLRISDPKKHYPKR
ncbi:MAG: hypothetical protein IJX16_03300 [Clostridia bacterium]|nr:hypothetical protein [Clostridia bacterium]